MSMIDIQQEPQKAVLFGTDRPENEFWGEQPLEELGRLAETAGAVVVDRVVQRGRKIDPVTYIGKGKAEEIKQVIESTGADLAIFDDELSPSQARNLEERFDLQVLDRTELILDIFAHHARTTESKLQVELAQLEYLLPRLKNMWVHLSRIRGGIGLRGPGETQLETDRRLIQKQITLLKRKLRKIENQHHLRMAGRESIRTFALVGYTNAGKSSLLKALSGSRVLVRDQLFSTLDTTTRKVKLDKHEVLFSDTVGFISRLPHHLVASFKATLEELVGADHLLLVVDVSNPHFAERIKVVEDVLAELGAGEVERTLVFNKTDLVTDRQLLFQAAESWPDAVFSSAVDGERGLKHIRDRIINMIEADESEFSIELEPEEGELAAAFHRLGRVLERSIEDGSLKLRVRMPRPLAMQLVKGTPYEIQLTRGRTT
ncbi:MAG: GTPase HflX [Candidatus Glassbacteria bacterium]|nr:GTPase HflX [Candidatus Glassbacteria bacterium]